MNMLSNLFGSPGAYPGGACPGGAYPGGAVGSYPYGGMPSAYPGTMPGAYTSYPGPIGTPMSPAMPPGVPSGSYVTPTGGNIVTLPAVEESYVENIVRLNRGKLATVYMTFENNSQWNAKVFRGLIEAAGRDHIILSDPVTGMRYLLLTVNLDYITFDQPIVYEYPFQGGVVTNTTPAARGQSITGSGTGS